MRFSQRNVYYLRTSPRTVIQMILYLDDRHVRWMNENEFVLDKVLSELRTRIFPKLRNEAGTSGVLGMKSNKETVDVFRGDTFQMGYFFRKMDQRHAVLLKDKELVFPSPSLHPVDDAAGCEEISTSEPKASGTQFSATRKRKRQSSGNCDADESPRTDSVAGPSSRPLFRAETEEPAEADAHERLLGTRRSMRQRKNQSYAEGDEIGLDDVDDQDYQSVPTSEGSGGPPERRQPRSGFADDAVEVKQEEEEGMGISLLDDVPTGAPLGSTLEIDEDTKDEKLKPKLRVNYSGFQIFGKLLVVVVEPLKSEISRQPELFASQAPSQRRELSATPSRDRGETPQNRNGASFRSMSRSVSLMPPPTSSRRGGGGMERRPLFRSETPESTAGSIAPSVAGGGGLEFEPLEGNAHHFLDPAAPPMPRRQSIPPPPTFTEAQAAAEAREMIEPNEGRRTTGRQNEEEDLSRSDWEWETEEPGDLGGGFTLASQMLHRDDEERAADEMDGDE